MNENLSWKKHLKFTENSFAKITELIYKANLY